MTIASLASYCAKIAQPRDDAIRLVDELARPGCQNPAYYRPLLYFGHTSVEFDS